MMLLATLAVLSAPAAELPSSAEALLPEVWSEAPPPVEAPWTDQLGGPELSALVAHANGANPDRLSGDERALQAQARITQARSALLPSASVNGSASYASVSPQFAAQPGVDDFLLAGGVTGDVSMSLSVWKTAPDVWASAADRDGAVASVDQLSVDTSVQAARLYVDLLYARERRAVVEAQVANDAVLLQLTEARYQAGDTGGIDLLQQTQQVASSRANLPDAQAAVTRAEQNLSAFLVVTGGAAWDVQGSRLPEVPPMPALAAPPELVGQHPSVQKALADLDASGHRVTSATANLLPDVSVSGTYGTQYSEFGPDPWTLNANVGGQVSVPVFNGGRNRAALREARSAERVSEYAVQGAVADVVATVRNGVATFEQRAAEVEAQTANRDAAAAALQASQEEYARGLAPYNSVLNALSTSKNADLTLLAAKRNHASAYLDLVSVSGGLWVDSI